MAELGDATLQQRGPHNSSQTRVRPYCGPRLAEDPPGRTWLPTLLAACPGRHPQHVISDPGVLEVHLSARRPYIDEILGPLELTQAIAHHVPPPRAILRSLLENPAGLR